MPVAAPKPCTRCGVVVRDGTSRCVKHKVREGSFADSRRGSRHKRGYGSEWDRRRLRILERDCGICQPCKREGRLHLGSEVDHVVSKAEWRRRHGSLDGVDDDENLQAIHRDCHRAKTAREAAAARSPAPAAPADPGGGRKSTGSPLRTDL